jgi:hypothetical protein
LLHIERAESTVCRVNALRCLQVECDARNGVDAWATPGQKAECFQQEKLKHH